MMALGQAHDVLGAGVGAVGSMMNQWVQLQVQG